MKTITTITATISLAALCCAGCKKSEDTVTGTGKTDAAPVEEISVEETVVETAETAKQAINDASAKAQEILTQAQNLVGEKKYEEAASLLQKLSNIELTPEQQKLLDDLKATIQKAMQSEAVNEGTKAIGNMLGGEK